MPDLFQEARNRAARPMNFGYARVSAQDQNLDTQTQQLQAAGCDIIHAEKISGATSRRPELDFLLEGLQAGDTVTVTRLNRLGRNTAHLLELVAQLEQKQVRLVALDLNIDTGTPQGKFILTVFAALAEFDREEIRAKSKAGIALAKERGTHMGRRPGLDRDKMNRIGLALDAGISLAGIVRLTNIPESTVKRYKRAIENGNLKTAA